MTTGVEVDGQLLFQPDAFATRGQAAAMLSRVYERYCSTIDWLNGFYAFSLYSQISFTDEMDVVSVGWARMSYDADAGPWLNSTSSGGKPTGSSRRMLPPPPLISRETARPIRSTSMQTPHRTSPFPTAPGPVYWRPFSRPVGQGAGRGRLDRRGFGLCGHHHRL